MTVAAIMQPTYLPWLGYFAMLDRADIFVFLDDVQFERRSWQQRNRLKGPNGPHYVTVPIRKKGRRDQLFRDAEIDHETDPMTKHARAIKSDYGKSPHFSRYAGPLFDILGRRHALLGKLNIEIIDWLADSLGIECRKLHASELGCAGNKAELLATICDRIDADTYLSAVGSKDYIEDSEAFSRRGIKVRYNDFDHPSYPQLHGPFVPHLSAIDLLFNVGPDGLDIIRSGYQAIAS